MILGLTSRGTNDVKALWYHVWESYINMINASLLSLDEPEDMGNLSTMKFKSGLSGWPLYRALPELPVMSMFFISNVMSYAVPWWHSSGHVQSMSGSLHSYIWSALLSAFCRTFQHACMTYDFSFSFPFHQNLTWMFFNLISAPSVQSCCNMQLIAEMFSLFIWELL